LTQGKNRTKENWQHKKLNNTEKERTGNLLDPRRKTHQSDENRRHIKGGSKDAA